MALLATMSLPIDPKSAKDYRPIATLSQSDAEAKLPEEEVSVKPLQELGVYQSTLFEP